ncbi:MAG: hypothetical protein ACK4K9_03085 [Bacteroidia bacterium]
MKVKILSVVFILLVLGAKAQPISKEIADSLADYEIRLMGLGQMMISTFDETTRLTSGKNFIINLARALRVENSYYYPFDSLKKYVMIKKAPDDAFRIITWNIATNDEHFRYFGVLQLNPNWIKKQKNKDEYKNFYPLIDRSDSLNTYLFKQTGPEQWFGATYYDIVKVSNNKIDYYCLFGWDGHTALSNRKIIDVLTFVNGKPLFGAPIFDLKQKRIFYRMVWEFSNRASMTVKYLPKQKVLIYENIVPDKPANAGNFSTYLPDGTFDYLIWKKGIWEKQPGMYNYAGD